MANRLLRKAEVCRRLGYQRETLRKRVASGLVPAPVYEVVGGPPLWPEDEIDAYIEQLKAKRDQPTGSEKSEAPSPAKEHLSGRGVV